MWPYGRIHLALVDLYENYRPKSRMDRIQLDMDKLTIKIIMTVIIIIIVTVAARHKQVYVPDVRDITIQRTVIMILRMLRSVQRVG
jgi:hypothetical protein